MDRHPFADVAPSFERLFDAVPCFLTVQSRDHRVLAANRRFREAFGSPEGRHCYQVYKRRPEKCETCPVERTFRDGQSHHSEEVVTCLDDSRVSVLVYTAPVRNDQGAIEAVVEMSTDVTDLKAVQAQLQESRARYRTLFEQVPCFISIQDAERNILDANRLHRENFGTFLGCKCYEVYKHRTEECYPCLVRQTFEDGRDHVQEGVVVARDGRPLNVLIHTAPIADAGGNVTAVMEMSADITAIRELQSQLTSIGLLIGSISHGLKGLLNGLNGGVYLVNRGLASGDQERVKQGWAIVQRNIGRIRSTVLDILYYAKDREPDVARLSSAAMLDQVYEQVQDKARELGVALTRSASPAAGEVEADEKAVRAMLVNLAENSLDACRLDRKKPAHHVQLRVDGDADHVWFEVEDDGVGMDRETREKVFTLFFSSKGSEGTGLGLFVANKIAAAHGGTIRLESALDVGTRFHVELPRLGLGRGQAAAPPPGDAARQPATTR